MSTPPRRPAAERTGGETPGRTPAERPVGIVLLGLAALGAAAAVFVVASVIGNRTGAFDAVPDEGWRVGFAVASALAGLLLLGAAALLGRAWGAERGGSTAPVIATTAAAAAVCLLVGLSLVSVGTEAATSMPAPESQRASSALAIALLACATVSVCSFVVALVRRPGESRGV
ncbi:hypothetical protein EDF54_3822 [Rathayibacter sp. PhB93]|uniref:hypothetical protein n=1 Tax=unclassified Rathayibacter TaxID=2609250 RepID=UPI000F46C28A|nr:MULTISPECIES: hypothetical protein [unclassified Rathayibacter]ROQ02185.1 hypothetical protein EDF54_3822 [Rathayibacter sp. PhB93]TDQ07742.1 hypothetical protein EDF17_3493 [Rathayibacter sp. PhB1]